MILLRQGQSEFNVVYGVTRVEPGIEDPALTALGRSQAAVAADALAGHGLTRVIASPYRRTLETAAVVAGRLGLAVSVEPIVREHKHFVCDIGTPASRLAALWPDLDFSGLEEQWWPEPDETFEQVEARARTFLGRLPAIGDWQRALVVTHWGFIRGLTGLRVTNGTAVRIDDAGRGEVVHAPEAC